MRILNYLLIAVFLVGCGSVFGQNETPTPNLTPKEVKEIIRLAEQGNAYAQFSLGLLYYLGEGVPQDYQLALKWYKLAAKQSEVEAQYNLGAMYALGQGVPQDYILSHKWFNLAAAKGVKKASKRRDDLAKEMNTSQIQEAQKLAREFKPKKEKP